MCCLVMCHIDYLWRPSAPLWPWWGACRVWVPKGVKLQERNWEKLHVLQKRFWFLCVMRSKRQKFCCTQTAERLACFSFNSCKLLTCPRMHLQAKRAWQKAKRCFKEQNLKLPTSGLQQQKAKCWVWSKGRPVKGVFKEINPSNVTLTEHLEDRFPALRRSGWWGS